MFNGHDSQILFMIKLPNTFFSNLTEVSNAAAATFRHKGSVLVSPSPLMLKACYMSFVMSRHYTLSSMPSPSFASCNNATDIGSFGH